MAAAKGKHFIIMGTILLILSGIPILISIITQASDNDLQCSYQSYSLCYGFNVDDPTDDSICCD